MVFVNCFHFHPQLVLCLLVHAIMVLCQRLQLIFQGAVRQFLLILQCRVRFRHGSLNLLGVVAMLSKLQLQSSM